MTKIVIAAILTTPIAYELGRRSNDSTDWRLYVSAILVMAVTMWLIFYKYNGR